jgi:hypothetical protein
MDDFLFLVVNILDSLYSNVDISFFESVIESKSYYKSILDSVI